MPYLTFHHIVMLFYMFDATVVTFTHYRMSNVLKKYFDWYTLFYVMSNKKFLYSGQGFRTYLRLNWTLLVDFYMWRKLKTCVFAPETFNEIKNQKDCYKATFTGSVSRKSLCCTFYHKLKYVEAISTLIIPFTLIL